MTCSIRNAVSQQKKRKTSLLLTHCLMLRLNMNRIKTNVYLMPYAQSNLYERKATQHSDTIYNLIYREDRIVLPKSLQRSSGMVSRSTRSPW